MKWLDKILNFFRRRNKTKMLNEGAKSNTSSITNERFIENTSNITNDKDIEKDNKINEFKKSLKIREQEVYNNKEVETDIIVGNGLGISDKLDY